MSTIDKARTERPKIELPNPGIYPNVPFEEYIYWPAISNSRLNLAAKSMLHFKMLKFREPTPALRLGQLVHCGILEPMAVIKRYVVQPNFENDADNKTGDGQQSNSKATKYYKAKVEEFRTVNAGKTVVSQDEYERLCGINEALFRSKRARQYLSEMEQTEVSIVWNDAETGLPLKARLDGVGRLAVGDLKTTQDAMAFSKSVANFGYHRQGAFYQTGWATLNGGELLPFRLIAVESVYPHGVRAAPLSDDAIDTGRTQVRQLLRDVAEARELDFYPCYDDPASWCLPSLYAGADDEVELTIGGESVTL